MSPVTKRYTDKMIEDEASKIFMKLNPTMARADGTFAKAYSSGATPKYNREYEKVFKQVKDVRKKNNQY